MESKSIRSKRHFIYDSYDEFISESKETNVVKNWREAKEGDWVMSDDDRVIQILKVGALNHPNDRKNYKYSNGYVRTVVGTFINREKTFMDTDFSKHPNRYTFSTTIKDTHKRVKQRKDVTKNEKIFAVNVASGANPVHSYMDTYNEPNENKAKRKAIVLLKQERVMQEIEKGVMDVAKTLGIDHEYILSTLKRLADFSDDDNIILQSTKELGKIIGTAGGKISDRSQAVGFFGFTEQQMLNAKEKIEGHSEDNNQVQSE